MTDRQFTNKEFMDFLTSQLKDILSWHEITNTLQPDLTLLGVETDNNVYLISIKRRIR